MTPMHLLKVLHAWYAYHSKDSDDNIYGDENFTVLPQRGKENAKSKTRTNALHLVVTSCFPSTRVTKKWPCLE